MTTQQGQQRFYLFGDQTFDLQPHLKDLLLYRNNPVLEDFLAKSYGAIRRHIYDLPPQIRDDLPRFTCVDDLILSSKQDDGKGCIALDMAITCMYQLGVFISHAHLQYPNAANARVLGLCTGALAAAAVSCSRSTLDLVPMAVTAVSTAFRTGMHVTDVAQRVEPSKDSKSDRSWSILVAGSATAEAVDLFCQQTKMPSTDQPYVSAYAPSGITVSGPPASLAQLRSSDVFKDFRSKSIPIFGPYHSPRLSSEDDIDEIVPAVCMELAARGNETPVISSTGTTVQETEFLSLLKAAVRQVLLQPIRWGSILDELQSWLSASAPQSFKIDAIGTTADQLIYNALKQTDFRKLIPSSPQQSKPDMGERPLENSSPENPKLAIIGLSGRYPGAKDNEAFWDLLYQGLDVHKPVPAFHWDAKTHVDPTGKTKNTSAAPFGCWLDDPAEFDARFFNISPREAAQIDPAQRIALMTAYEAIEQAGLVPDATPSTRRDRVGVFFGVTSNDWMETNTAQNIDTYFIPGGNRAFIPGRINYCFKFSGPSYAVDTACSSSLAGIHIACNALWRGDIDTAIAGGTNVLTNPDFTAGLDRGHFLSRTGNCKTFDDEADGYCRGEGVGTVIIKRLEDALADKDPIQAVIIGASTNHSAESESITRPHVGAQRAIFNKILNQGAIDPYDVSYVEMHGTGTQAGDAGEMSSVLSTFAPPLEEVKRGRNKDQALYLGSAKANIGHGEAVSGVSSLIKTLLMMKKNTIVPHAGIKTKINHRFPTDLEQRNVNIAKEPVKWERQGSKPRRVFVNNFSAAGGNSALLLEDAPIIEDDANEKEIRSVHIVTVSGKNGNSLQGNLRTLHSHLKQNSDVNMGQLSYTTTARRMHHQHRVTLTGSTPEDLCKQIETAINEQTGMTRPKSAPKVLFTYTGNGAQYPGMGKQLFGHFATFRKEMQRLDKIGQSLGFPSMLPVIQSDKQDIGIFAPTVVQLATTCLQIALSRLWQSWNVHPNAVVGHSLGEYAALNIAGVLSDTDTIHLVGRRAQLLEEKCTRDTHSMLVVKGSVKSIAGVLKERKFEVACINSDVETVLAGPNQDITDFQGPLNDAGLKSTLLKVPYAFYSSQVDPVLDEFTEVARGVKYSQPRIPILCPLEGNVIDTTHANGFVAEYFARHCREPVNMLTALTMAYADGFTNDQTTTLEIGPHPAVSGMVKANLPKIINLPSLQRGRSPGQTLTAALKALYNGGADIRWSEYHRDIKACQKVVPLPAYSWDLKPYWLQYVNDWSLRKGDPPLVIENTSSSKLESTTIHNVVREHVDGEKGHIVVEADIARKDLSPLVQGHEVDGIPLCTPSVYCDIALSLGKYLIGRYRPEQAQKLVDVSDMTISKALILNAKGDKQLLQAHTDVDWAANAAMIRFMSFDAKQKLQEHSRCTIRFADKGLQQELEKEAVTIKKKMQALRQGVGQEETARFNRPMVYRMIRPLARFHDDYRAIDEVILNSKTLEASSKLSFGSVKRGGDYHTHPAIIDALTQSCGFTMNCNDGVDLDKEVFMNHGWGGFQIFDDIDFDKEYTTYTQMHEGQDQLWYGDVVIFEAGTDKVVASFKQIAIQGVPRRVLKVILSIESGNKASSNQTSQKARSASKASSGEKKQTSSTAAKASAPAPAPAATPKTSQAIEIIAEESGIAVSDLADNTIFADVGIDSLMGLTISARFKEEIDLDIDFNSLFFEYPAVKDLKRLLGEASTPAAGSASTSEASSDSDDDSMSSSAPSQAETDTTVPKSGSDVDFNKALAIVSEESGVAIEDLTDDTNFTDSGVDSLLSLVVTSRFRDELELDIQHESLFLECPTVADLRKLLCGQSGSEEAHETAKPDNKSEAPAPELEKSTAAETKETHPPKSQDEVVSLETRRKAVMELVAKYSDGFKVPTPDPSGALPQDNEKVVLVTGASGSLGGHLAFHLAQLPDVKTVVCLNRENRAEPYERQIKAMREKGIRFPENLKSKLRVFQTDTSKRRFGLADNEYDSLTSTVTHLIHNAWPMSAKRPLAGFESQFQVFRNLIHFACNVAAKRPESFRFGFQMVSSIGVVGQYEINKNQGKRTVVPEERMDIDSVLTNGYGEAKWGCEQMLDATLHKHPQRFRTMAVRLGQIAGSKTSGYWNPMEHFGFLVKSSQTLNALPDLDGGLFWTPVNDIAGALSDLVLAKNEPHPIYHIENPVGQPWKQITNILAESLHIPSENVIPFAEWMEKVRIAPQKDNPASTLLDFLDDNFLRMSCGGLVLDTKNSVEHSRTLAEVGPVSEIVARKYIHIWREIGFLKSSAKDRASFDEERKRLWG